MGLVVVIADFSTTSGFALSGATVRPIDNSDEARRAWDDLPDDTLVVVLSPDAAAAIGDRPAPRSNVLRVVLPS